MLGAMCVGLFSDNEGEVHFQCTVRTKPEEGQW